MVSLYFAVLVASLLGSLHCVGMCGPLAVLSSNVRRGERPQWRNIAAYHSGRVMTYALMGGIAGWIGLGVQGTGTLLGMQRFAAQLAGGSLLVIGLLGIVRLVSGTPHAPWIPLAFHRMLAAGHAWARRQRPLPRAAVVGVLTAILPCGWLYAFLLVAAGSASAFTGAMVMGIFALGSIPALLGVVWGATTAIGRFSSWAPWFSAILVTLVGGYTLVHRSALDLAHWHGPGKSSPYSLVRHIQEMEQEELPCCIEEEK